MISTQYILPTISINLKLFKNVQLALLCQIIKEQYQFFLYVLLLKSLIFVKTVDGKVDTDAIISTYHENKLAPH